MTPNLFQRLIALAAAAASVLVLLLVPKVYVAEGTVLSARIPRPALAPVLDWRTLLPLLGGIALVSAALWFAAGAINDQPFRLLVQRMLFGPIDDKGRRRGGFLSTKPIAYTLLVTVVVVAAAVPDWVGDHLIALLAAMVLVPALGLALGGIIRKHFVKDDADPLAKRGAA